MVAVLKNWLRRRQKKTAYPAARALPFVEHLEKRDVPSATIYWTGGAGTTNWDQAGNWSTVDPLIGNLPSMVLPGPTDNVIIDLAGVTVDHSAGSHDVIGSLRVTGAHVTLKLSAGILDLSGAGTSGTFQVDQAGDVVNLRGGKPSMALTGGALERLNKLTPPGHIAQIDLSITDDWPLAQAFVIISAVPAGKD